MKPGTLKVRVAGRYGVETIYPECETARLFCALLRQKTLTRADVEGIKRLGYAVETVEKLKEAL